MQHILAAITLSCAVALLVMSMCALNGMGRRTNHFIRLAFIAVGFAEFSLLAGAVFGHTTAARFEVAALNAAMLLFMLFNRRRGLHAVSDVG